ncbi:MAG: hypothetical protein ACK5KR_08910 [Breznakia sp.]
MVEETQEKISAVQEKLHLKANLSEVMVEFDKKANTADVYAKSEIADRIIDEGFDDFWTWEKYNSGLVKLWGADTLRDYKCNQSWGSLYVSGANIDNCMAFPFNLTELIHINCSVHPESKEGNGWFMHGNVFTSGNFLTHTGNWEYVRATSYTAKVKACFEVVGKWK